MHGAISSRGGAFAAITVTVSEWSSLNMVIRVFYQELLMNVSAYADDTSRYLRPTLAESLEVREGLWYVVIWAGVSASLPTAVYLPVLLPLKLLRVVPRALQHGLSRVVFLVTTDLQSVLEQVAIFSSNVGNLLGAIVAWTNLPP
jgi:hypothetical protein